MANSLIINNSTVINSSLDFTGRNISSSGSVTVGSTTITSTSINVQNLTIGSISSSGGGFNINGAGTFSGALSAGSISTGGTFSAGNSVFNGTITLGSVLIQNGQYNVGSAYLNGSNLSVPGTVYAAGVAFGGNVGQGIYTDSTNIAVRAPSTNGGVYLQNGTGSTSWAYFLPGGAQINQNLTLAGGLTLTTGAQIQTDYAGNGGVRLVNGGAGQTGYIEFRGANTAAPRLGYIGLGPTAGGAISISGEGSSYFNFIGNGPQVNGSPIVTNSSLPAQLGSYVTTSGLSSTLSNYAALSGAGFNGNVNMNNGAGTRYLASGADWLVRGIGNRLQMCDGGATVEYFSFGTDGSISTRQFGDLNNRIESRAAAFADDRKNSCVTSGRWVYAGDKGYNDQPGTGGFISPFGGHTMHCDYWSWRFSVADGQVGSAPFAQRFRAFQVYIASQGWVTCGAAS